MSGVGENAGRTTWPEVLGDLTALRELDAPAVRWAMSRIMEGDATPAQVAAFGVALKIKGPTATELDELAATMLDYSTPVRTQGRCLDIVGTGGDRQGTVNISTMSTVVASACGVPVSKHGNRAASSKSGGADVLEALGVAIDLSPTAVEKCLDEVGTAFCFAPVFHPALRFAAAPRREIGIPTVFNVLGPLTNPAAPDAGLIGCAFEDLMPVMAGVFARRGRTALVVRGSDGLDEITVSGPTEVLFAHEGEVTEHELTPEDVGLATSPLDALRGGDAEFNAQVARALFSGETGPVRDAVEFNTAAALVAFAPEGAREDLAAAVRGAREKVAEAIDSGAATRQLERWAETSRRLATSG